MAWRTTWWVEKRTQPFRGYRKKQKEKWERQGLSEDTHLSLWIETWKDGKE